MNIFSCDGCGGIFDIDKIELPTEIGDDGTKDNWEWNGNGFTPLFKCPICEYKTPVTKK